MKFLACCVLPEKKIYGNCLYWCKYVRDFNGATQWLKGTVPDRRIWLPTHACVIVATDNLLFDFYRKRGHGPDRNHYNQSWIWSRLQTTLAQIPRKVNIQWRSPPKWTWDHTQVNIHWIHFLKIFSPFRIFEQLALALKNRDCLKFFTVLNIIFTIQDFLTTLRLPW